MLRRLLTPVTHLGILLACSISVDVTGFAGYPAWVGAHSTRFGDGPGTTLGNTKRGPSAAEQTPVIMPSMCADPPTMS